MDLNLKIDSSSPTLKKKKKTMRHLMPNSNSKSSKLKPIYSKKRKRPGEENSKKKQPDSKTSSKSMKL